MKYLLLLLLSINIIACDSIDDDSPQDPISQLPEATTIGANTFGALLDGEPFIPSGGSNPLDCVYQLINGERFFTVDAAKRDEDFNLTSLSLSTNAKELQVGQTYRLNSNLPGNVYGQYFFQGESFFTNLQQTGELNITRLDLNAQIVSGTFFYDIIDGNGNFRQIREGRFDMRFTQ